MSDVQYDPFAAALEFDQFVSRTAQLGDSESQNTIERDVIGDVPDNIDAVTDSAEVSDDATAAVTAGRRNKKKHLFLILRKKIKVKKVLMKFTIFYSKTDLIEMIV